MGADMAPGLAISVATRGKINPTLALPDRQDLPVELRIRDPRRQGPRHCHAPTRPSMQLSSSQLRSLPTKRLEKLIGEDWPVVAASSPRSRSGCSRKPAPSRLPRPPRPSMPTPSSWMKSWPRPRDSQLRSWTSRCQRQAVTLIGTIVGGGGMAATHQDRRLRGQP